MCSIRLTRLSAYEVSITDKMTVSSPGHPATDDPQASLRTQLLGKLIVAQMALEKAIGELIRSGANTTGADAQLTHLATLQTSIGTANAATLAAMSGEVTAAVAQSKVIVDQARDQATAAAAGLALTLADAASSMALAARSACARAATRPAARRAASSAPSTVPQEILRRSAHRI